MVINETFVIFQLWLILVIVLLLTIVLLRCFSSGKISLWIIFIRLITNQGCDEITQWKWNFKFINFLNKFSFILLIVIWSQSASILTKAFTGLLLITYFNQTYVPIVKTLDDIYSNKDILIASSSTRFQSSTRKLILYKSFDLLNDIYNRIVEFEQVHEYRELDENHYLTDYIFTAMIKGRIIILLNTQRSRDFQYHWKDEASRFHVSDQKYGLNYVNYLGAKNHKQINMFKLMLVISSLFTKLVYQ